MGRREHDEGVISDVDVGLIRNLCFNSKRKPFSCKKKESITNLNFGRWPGREYLGAWPLRSVLSVGRPPVAVAWPWRSPGASFQGRLLFCFLFAVKCKGVI